MIGNLGNQSLGTGQYRPAAAYYREAIAILREQPSQSRDEWAMGVCEANLGVVGLLAGHPEAADVHLNRALARHRSTGDQVLESITLANLGDHHHRRLGRSDRAAEYLREALGLIDRTTGNPRLRAKVLAVLAELVVPAGPAGPVGPAELLGPADLLGPGELPGPVGLPVPASVSLRRGSAAG
ncbi:tetratricopeptide repeat protein [Kitasatospora sp. NPDC088351]|uniref:tetratricopeptide repeat protein n=1 Tax=Kitasatospora sp. NPDC088351 TaxID=3155180 RepID=UPI003415F523